MVLSSQDLCLFSGEGDRLLILACHDPDRVDWDNSRHGPSHFVLPECCAILWEEGVGGPIRWQDLHRDIGGRRSLQHRVLLVASPPKVRMPHRALGIAAAPRKDAYRYSLLDIEHVFISRSVWRLLLFVGVPMKIENPNAVSYTHLTLPTKRIV